MERLIETLRPISRKAEAEGVVLALETHALSILDLPVTCREIVEAVGSPNLCLILDAVNHFQSMHQVYNSSDWVNHIFDELGMDYDVMSLMKNGGIKSELGVTEDQYSEMSQLNADRRPPSHWRRNQSTLPVAQAMSMAALM